MDPLPHSAEAQALARPVKWKIMKATFDHSVGRREAVAQNESSSQSRRSYKAQVPQCTELLVPVYMWLHRCVWESPGGWTWLESELWYSVGRAVPVGLAAGRRGGCLKLLLAIEMRFLGP